MLKVRFETGMKDRFSPVIPIVQPSTGEAFLQLTYRTLRIGPDGDDIARYEGGLWIVDLPEETSHPEMIEPFDSVDGTAWTDIVIWEEPDEA